VEITSKGGASEFILVVPGSSGGRDVVLIFFACVSLVPQTGGL
jgi:hypothetical protein